MRCFKRHTIKLIALLLLLQLSCVEEFEPKSEIKEDTEQLASALVVDGLLTDEFKRHKIILTRVFSFEEENPAQESGALVKIVSSMGAEQIFEESEPGIYFSQAEFSAQEGEEYILNIDTQGGDNYYSEKVTMPEKIAINNLRADRVINDNGEDGVGIFLDNTSTTLESTYFRYEYQETYKIIAPKWDPFKLNVVRYEPCFVDPFVVEIIPWSDERRVCYSSNNSQRIIQTSSIDLENSAIDNFQIHFIDSDNYIISHRYSINVKQYSQTQEAFLFYERLSDFSSSDNVFSQIQPGFFQGNMFSASNNREEKVLGYFEVASVTSERLYFNYEDIFPGESLPPYAINCETLGSPRLIPRAYHCASTGVCDGNCESPLIEQILAGLITFAGEKEDDFISPYFTLPSPCGDCTKLGSNIVPEFWIE
jgi:hypothetical protein